jgi:hypothetical protein
MWGLNFLKTKQKKKQKPTREQPKRPNFRRVYAEPWVPGGAERTNARLSPACQGRPLPDLNPVKRNVLFAQGAIFLPLRIFFFFPFLAESMNWSPG